jgi:hypothetical protein
MKLARRCAVARCRSAGRALWSITSSLGQPDTQILCCGYRRGCESDSAHAPGRGASCRETWRLPWTH